MSVRLARLHDLSGACKFFDREESVKLLNFFAGSALLAFVRSAL
jgi:hypothetical protein